MEHIFIQVIDPSPESAEEIKSLLRNSGINVHVLNAASAKQAEQQIKEFRPSLIIYQSASGPEIPVELIGEMARLNGVFLAVRFAPENTEVFTRALAETACIGLDESESDRVIDLVGLLAGMGHAARELHAASAHHDELQKRYELLLETTNEAVAYLHEGLHVFANTAYLKALQVKEFSELESLSMLDVVRSGDLDLKTLIRDFNQGIFPAEPLSATVRGPAGNEFEALLTFAPVRFGGEHCVQKVIRQQGAGGNLHQELDRIRSLDQLTGTHHRQYFMQELECALDNMDDRDSGAVFYLEPDGIRAHLKTWTTADHDDYVVRLAQEVRDHLDGDLVARFGDTSFSFLALRDHKGELGQLGEAIRAGVELMPPGKHGNEQPKSCSIGMVMLGPQIGSAEEALVQARSAFLKAAKSGNTLCRYRPSRRANGDEDEGTQWVERLKYALNNDDFYSVQNAVINLEGESEGLFENQTFLHEEDRDVGLEEFAAAADRANLASAIDRQVIPGLLRAISGSGDRHIINVSGNSVQDFSFASWFQRQLQEYDVQGSQLILQVTVEAASSNLRATRRMFDELATLGCSFSVAHFDDRKNSVELLDRLKPAFVKLAPGLIHDLANQQANQSIIKNVASTAAAVGVNVFADEVQNSNDMALLWQCGVKLVAGDFLQDAPRVAGQ